MWQQSPPPFIPMFQNFNFMAFISLLPRYREQFNALKEARGKPTFQYTLMFEETTLLTVENSIREQSPFFLKLMTLALSQEPQSLKRIMKTFTLCFSNEMKK